MVLLFRFGAEYKGNIGMEGHSFSDAYGHCVMVSRHDRIVGWTGLSLVESTKFWLR